MPAQHLREALHENETVKASLREANTRPAGNPPKEPQVALAES
jgi:hypothetical protein